MWKEPQLESSRRSTMPNRGVFACSRPGTEGSTRLPQDILPQQNCHFRRVMIEVFYLVFYLVLPRNGVHQDRFTLPINSRRCSPFPPQPTYCEETGRAPSLVDRARGLLNLCQRHGCYGTHRVPGTYRTAQGTSAWLAVVACVSVSPNVCLFSPFSRSAVFERIRARISATRVLSTPV